ncbi:MAG TPA: hypothetical protein ACFYEF_05450 [Candidatus Wunengus sp. YC63]|uniref:hypothetical protein n=1 Tax=unclassified Candidatus Wunengus TaxID=3367695 RepID=UPI004027A42C
MALTTSIISVVELLKRTLGRRNGAKKRGQVLLLDVAVAPFSRCNKLKPNGFLNARNG